MNGFLFEGDILLLFLSRGMTRNFILNFKKRTFVFLFGDGMTGRLVVLCL